MAGEEGDWVGDVPAVAGTVPRTKCCGEALCCMELTVAEDTDRWQEWNVVV